MCGIFGATGNDSVAKTVAALKRLEYRGYDSAGVAAKQNGAIDVVKAVGRVSELDVSELGGSLAIGHTRWATHGAVLQKNAHPFLSDDGGFAVVHNGIIENYTELKSFLVGKGFSFASDTDSETVAQLLQYEYDGNVARAVAKTAEHLVGSYSVALLNVHDNCLYAFKNKCPLVVALAENEAYVCSDVNTASHFANKVAVMPDRSAVKIDGAKVTFFSYDGQKLNVPFSEVQTAETEEICDDMMMKEMLEIPDKIACAKQGYLSQGMGLSRRKLASFRRVYLIGCGTAYHSGLSAAAVFRKLTDVDVIPVVASEFNYDAYTVDGKTLALLITQSGETADTVSAAEKVKLKGGFACAVTNTPNSTICFKCHRVVFVNAGEEIAVASTKAYNCQLTVLCMMALDVALARNGITAKFREECLADMDKLPQAASAIINRREDVKRIAERISKCSAVFFIGRKGDWPTAAEGSLKLKEISYLHSEAYAAGELKHGTLALIEESVAVVAIATDSEVVPKLNSAVSEVSSRGARVVLVSPYGGSSRADRIMIPAVNPLFYGIISVIPLQLLAYYTATTLGRDVDKPRHLAKSVTVE